MRGTPAVFVLAGIALFVAAGCGQPRAMQSPPTPLPVVADLTGVTAEGRLEPVRFVTLAPTVSGPVSEVLVTEGEQVDAGQLIARLGNAGAQTLESAQTQVARELGNAYETLRVAQNDLDAYPLPRVFAALTAEEAARTWLAELDAANAAFAPFRDTSRKSLRPRNSLPGLVYPSLPPRVLVDTGEYDDMGMVHKKRLDVAWMNYTKAIGWLRLDAAVQSAKARVADAQRQYDRLRETTVSDVDAATRSALATAEIRAPFAGTITELNLKAGEAATAGTPIATLADFSSWIVKTTDLTEIDVVAIQEGMPVQVILDSMAGTTFSGHVLSVRLNYSDRQGDIVYPVRILLADPNAAMRWGMTAQIVFGE